MRRIYKNQIQISVHCIIVLLFLVSTSCMRSQQNSNAIAIVDITTIQEKVIGKNVQFVDIRTPKEYGDGYIDDAVNISISDKEKFITLIEKLDKEKPIYIYCYSGWRSHRAAKLLASIGFKEVYDFKGGYKAWIAY